jgi:GT2 family glycosyltransferase
MTGAMHPVVVLASAGRPELLSEALEDVLAQTVPVDVVVSVPDGASLPSTVPAAVRVVTARGLAAQRNAGVEAIEDRDAIVFFFDDDAVVSPDYVDRALDVFASDPGIVGLTGRVLLDGATGEAIDRERADAAIAADAGFRTRRTHHWEQLYGCNFAYRRAAAPAELFDARLPLYSWLEDHDFARRLLRHGRIVKADDCVIVHRGVKSGGRAAHARLGYSQMMNPLYLHRKGSFPLWLTAKEIVPRCGKNLVLSLGGPEATWRRQRLRGNLAALRDAVTGSFEPERMLRY